MKEPKASPAAGRPKRQKKVSISLGADKTGAYSGNFRSEELLATYKLGVEDGKLVLQSIRSGDGLIHSSQRLLLRAVGQDTFDVDEEGLEFVFDHDAKGAVSGFHLDAGRTKGLIFSRD
jgi:hypothetical protein